MSDERFFGFAPMIKRAVKFDFGLKMSGRFKAGYEKCVSVIICAETALMLRRNKKDHRKNEQDEANSYELFKKIRENMIKAAQWSSSGRGDYIRDFASGYFFAISVFDKILITYSHEEQLA